MSRLPPHLQPAWPLVKRVHRTLSFLLGLLFRRTSVLAGSRSLPRDATTSSAETARREPSSVTLRPGGPAEDLKRELPLGEPGEHWAYEAERRYQVRPRYALEMRGGVTVGEYAAHITAGGLLDYETSRYFGISGWREHPLYLRPWLPRATHVEGTLLDLVSPGSTANYYHFVMDVLPRWGIAREALPDLTPDAIRVAHRLGYQKQLLELVGLGEHRLIEPSHRQRLTADRLIVPSTNNDELAAPPWSVAWLRQNLPAPRDDGPPRRLYATRGTRPHTRRYVREAELWPELERRGFERLDPGSLSVTDQIDRFGNAEIVVGPHGAGLTNLVFARPGTKVLELFDPTYVNLCYWTITEALGNLEYRYEVAAGDVQPGTDKTGVLADIDIPVSQVLRAVDELIAT